MGNYDNNSRGKTTKITAESGENFHFEFSERANNNDERREIVYERQRGKKLISFSSSFRNAIKSASRIYIPSRVNYIAVLARSRRSAIDFERARTSF
jgi:hypothetical protein